MQRFAKLNLDQVHTANASDPACPVNALGEQLCQSYDLPFAHTDDANKKWELFNDFAVRLLLLNGATWEKGPHVRGRLPKFRKIQMSAPQEAAGNLASPYLLLQACLRSLRELAFRFGRVASGAGDCRIAVPSILHRGNCYGDSRRRRSFLCRCSSCLSMIYLI